MADSKGSLDIWMERVLQTASTGELAAVLDDFRKHEWTDDDRSRLSHCYIQKLAVLPKESVSDAAMEQQVSSDDGPVWYEKM